MPTVLHQLFALSRTKPSRILLLALLGIVCGALNAGMLTAVAETLKAGAAARLWVGALFLGAFVLYLGLQRFSLHRIAGLAEQATCAIRQQVLVAVHDASLVHSERLDPHALRTLLLRDATALASALPILIGILGSFATVACGLAYMAWLSPVAAAIVCVVIVLASVLFRLMMRATQGQMRAAHAEVDKAFGFADDLLRGYKELKLDARWSDEFMRDDLLQSMRRASQLTGALVARQQDIGLIGVGAFYLLIGCLTFVFVSWLKLDSGVMISAVMVLLFLQAHIHGIVLRLPGLNEALFAARRIERVLAEARSHGESAQAGAALPPDWRAIRLEQVGFRYGPAEAGQQFQLRDIDLTIPRGATVFLVGANGSGKTTLAKLLLGLYRPSEGTILLDDVAVTAAHALSYRGLFNAVFSDAHLFRRSVLGYFRAAEPTIRAILADMKITLSLTADQRIDVKPFSQGQKKRLASTFSLVDDKPVCLFDEWTADQDPEFRHYFYHSYLPMLKAAGKTLLVISHDDRYFHLADLVIKMEGGKVAAVSHPRQAAAAA